MYKEFLEIVGNGKPTGSVSKETLAVSATISISVVKIHQQIRLRILSCSRVSENHREPEVPEVKVRVVECRDGLARITSEELAITHFVKNGTLQNACSTRPRAVVGLGRSAHSHIALGGVVKARTIRILPEDEKWSGASILDVKGTPRRPNPLVDDDAIPEDIAECAFDQQGQDDHDRVHEESVSQEPVLVRMSEIVPRTVTEEVWRSMYVTRRLIAQYGKTPECPGCENLGEKNGPSNSTECRQRLQDQMSNTSEGKTKLDEEQKRRDAFTARRMMSASHVPVVESPSSNIEHEGRAPPCKTSQHKDPWEQTQRVKQT